MKIAMIQMNMRLGEPEYNYARAEEMISQAVEEGSPDTILLPETWNTGFFPEDTLEEQADGNGERTVALMSRLAKEYQVNIVAGSVTIKHSSTACGSEPFICNRSYIINRDGEVVTSYDKAHLFTNMGEDDYYQAGGEICTFTLDDIRCGLVICYDIRFPEWIRKTALQGIDVLFVPAQWPGLRRSHWEILNRARAIENQMYVAACNSCGMAGTTKYGGTSLLIDPNGEILTRGDAAESILYGEIDPESFKEFKKKIPVFRDRRPDIYDR